MPYTKTVRGGGKPESAQAPGITPRRVLRSHGRQPEAHYFGCGNIQGGVVRLYPRVEPEGGRAGGMTMA